MALPKNLRYSEYVWVKLDGGVATLGITDYGLKQVKEIVFIDLPKKGQKIARGDTFVSLESVKWSGHIKSPVSGLVSAVNDALFDEPEKLNRDPFNSWVCKMTLSKPDEFAAIMDSPAAEKWVKENLG